MLHKIEDETGHTWYVGKGDPCHAAVQKLHTRYYTWIVLPRAMLQFGAMEQHSSFDGEHTWKDALREAHRLGYNSQGGRRRLRLAECLKVLGG